MIYAVRGCVGRERELRKQRTGVSRYWGCVSSFVLPNLKVLNLGTANGNYGSVVYRKCGKRFFHSVLSPPAIRTQTPVNQHSQLVAWRVQRSLPDARESGDNKAQENKQNKGYETQYSHSQGGTDGALHPVS